MFNFLKRKLPTSGRSPERPSVISQTEAELPLELRFRMQPNRIYRKFPFDSTEQIMAKCQFCGGPIFGETQENCLFCAQAILPRMVDVTDEPNHLIKPTNPDQPQVVSAESLIPTFGGDNIDLGQNAVAAVAIGNKVKAEYHAEIDRVAGNEVELHGYCTVTVIVAKNLLNAWGGLECDRGLTAKEISLGSGCQIEGLTVVPEKGSLSAGERTVFDVIYVGAGSDLAFGDKCEVGRLVILGPGVKIKLGKNCTITDIETDSRFQIMAGDNYENDTQYKLRQKYDLLEMINRLVDLALDL